MHLDHLVSTRYDLQSFETKDSTSSSNQSVQENHIKNDSIIVLSDSTPSVIDDSLEKNERQEETDIICIEDSFVNNDEMTVNSLKQLNKINESSPENDDKFTRIKNWLESNDDAVRRSDSPETEEEEIIDDSGEDEKILDDLRLEYDCNTDSIKSEPRRKNSKNQIIFPMSEL